MAYLGSTELSSVANPPLRLIGGVGGTVNTLSTAGNGGQMWLYNSSNGSTVLFDANFFTDAQSLGMRKGDIVFWCGSTGSSNQCGFAMLGAVTSNGAALGTTSGAVSSTMT